MNIREERGLTQGGEIISGKNLSGEKEWDALGTRGVIAKAGKRECLVFHRGHKIPLEARCTPTMSTGKTGGDRWFTEADRTEWLSRFVRAVCMAILYLFHGIAGDAISLLVAPNEQCVFMREKYLAVLRANGFLQGHEVFANKCTHHFSRERNIPPLSRLQCLESHHDISSSKLTLGDWAKKQDFTHPSLYLNSRISTL